MALDDMDELLRGLEQEPVFVEESGARPQAPAGRGSRRRAKPAVASGLRPWQNFILSFFLFWDVVIVGLLMLLMLERIALPY